MSIIASTIRNLSNRYETQTRFSGETSSMLRSFPDGEEVYVKLQSSERTLRASKEALDAKVARVTELRAAAATHGRTLESASEACVLVCEAHGVGQVRSVLVADAHDEAAIADNIAEYIRDVPHVGTGLAKWLRELRASFVATEASLVDANTGLEESMKSFAAQLHKSAATISHGRALLVSLGARLPRAKSPRTRKPRLTIVPQPIPVPTPQETLPAVG